MSRRLSLMRSDVNFLMEETPSQREVELLESTIASLEAEVALLQNDVVADIDKQQAVLGILTETVSNNSDQYGTLEANITTLGNALGAIQGDIVDNGSRIDSLGGEVDSVQTAVFDLDTAVGDLGTEMIAMEEEAMAMIEEINSQETLQETLALFRVWELITRARLRLLESNIGLARADITAAVQTIEALLALENGQITTEKLEMLQGRLALAFINLPDNPDLAAADLESAWDELDLIFTKDILAGISILPETDAVEESSAAEESDEAEESGAAAETPVPTATPSS